MKRKSKKIKILKGEKIVTFLIGLAFLFLPLSTVFTKAILSETNIALEQMKNQISDQEDVNESLSMQVDELASLDKILEVAEEKGMTYNNSNIKSISD